MSTLTSHASVQTGATLPSITALGIFVIAARLSTEDAGEMWTTHSLRNEIRTRLLLLDPHRVRVPLGVDEVTYCVLC